MLKKRKRIIIGAIGILFLLLVMRSCGGANRQTQEAEEAAPTAISADIISYGNWTPEGNREVLITVESDAEVDLISELSGTIGNVYVNSGDTVRKGQHLASFERVFDQTQIAYQNSILALETARAAANNSVQNAEITLENARTSLGQTIATEDQGILQIFETLRTQSKNVESSFQSALDLVDQWVGYTPQYRYSNDNRSALSNRDRILFNQLYNQTGTLIRSLQALQQDPGGIAPGSQSIGYARDRVSFAKQLQPLLISFENLAQRALISDSFTQTEADTLLTLIRTQKSTLNSELLSLETALENARTSNERKAATILTAENAVKTAESSLELAQANAKTQIQTAQNQVNASSASKNDLIIRAPFNGTVVEKFVNVGQQVGLNQQLFTVLNPNTKQKIVAFLTTQELARLRSQETIRVELGEIELELDQSAVSARLDANTQKMRVEFVIPSNLEKEILVGQIGKLMLDTDKNAQNLIPISSVSFEPDGAEVLVINADGITERRSIDVGTVKSDGVTVQTGLLLGDKVIQYKNRVYAGQEIQLPEIAELPVSTNETTE